MSKETKRYQYLDSLPLLTAEEKAKIVAQGYETAACLYGLIKAAEAKVFNDFLGRDCRDELLAALEKILTPEELAYLNEPVDTSSMGLGAVLPEESSSSKK